MVRGTVPVLLYCELCPASLSIPSTPRNLPIEKTAASYGWQSSPRGWRCPKHVKPEAPKGVRKGLRTPETDSS